MDYEFTQNYSTRAKGEKVPDGIKPSLLTHLIDNGIVRKVEKVERKTKEEKVNTRVK